MYANYTGIRYSGQEKMKDTGTDRDNPIISCIVDGGYCFFVKYTGSYQQSTFSIKGL